MSELGPDKPLRSISFAGNEPPSVNSYNVLVAIQARGPDCMLMMAALHANGR